MAAFFQEVAQLPGRHRTNVCVLLILKLSSFQSTSLLDQAFIRALTTELKIFFQNHEQQWSGLAFILKQNLAEHPGISPILLAFLSEVLDTLSTPHFKAFFNKSTLEPVDLHCEFQRIFESQLAVNLLLNPSEGMWASVNELSEVILSRLEKLQKQSILEIFFKNLGPVEPGSKEPYLALAFGRFAMRPKLEDVVSVLKEKTNLSRIMLIQFMFMRDVYPYFKELTYPARCAKPRGDIALYLMTERNLHHFFWNYPESAPHLYTDRGRGEHFKFKLSNQLGIGVSQEVRAIFPQLTNAWYPDCLCQEIDLQSPYVRQLITQDIPYVSGPSGMTTLFCSAMLFLGQWPDEQKQNNYLLSVLAFMTSGGLHSMHEVLTIPHVRLGLLPEYRVHGAHRGNYHDFLTRFSHDLVVMNNVEQAWRELLQWVSDAYPQLIGINFPPLPEPASALGVSDDLQSVLSESEEEGCFSWTCRPQ